MMNRAIMAMDFLAAALGLAGAAMARQEATPAAARRQERTAETPASKNGTGVVPPE